jgi:hypothetical protein
MRSGSPGVAARRTAASTAPEPKSRCARTASIGRFTPSLALALSAVRRAERSASARVAAASPASAASAPASAGGAAGRGSATAAADAATARPVASAVAARSPPLRKRAIVARAAGGSAAALA